MGLILFNIILLYLSYKFKNYNIILYTYLLILLIYIILKYKKIIEGNIEGDIYKVFKESLPTEDVLEFPMEKLGKILKLLKTQLTGDEKYDHEYQCQGKFTKKKLTNKTCGVGFNERVYKITKPGQNCLHTEKYKEKVPLKLCNYGEKCNIDLDCRSGRCDNGTCTYDLKCNSDMPESCDYDSCMNLNDKDNDVDDFIYKNNNCNKNPCNKDTYILCDNLDCENLGYLYKYNMDQNVCEKMNVTQDDPNEDVDAIDAKITVLQNLEKKYSCSNTFSQNLLLNNKDVTFEDCRLESDMDKMTVKKIYTDIQKNDSDPIYYVYENDKCSLDDNFCVSYGKDDNCIQSSLCPEPLTGAAERAAKRSQAVFKKTLDCYEEMIGVYPVGLQFSTSTGANRSWGTYSECMKSDSALCSLQNKQNYCSNINRAKASIDESVKPIRIPPDTKYTSSPCNEELGGECIPNFDWETSVQGCMCHMYQVDDKYYSLFYESQSGVLDAKRPANMYGCMTDGVLWSCRNGDPKNSIIKLGGKDGYKCTQNTLAMAHVSGPPMTGTQALNFCKNYKLDENTNRILRQII